MDLFKKYPALSLGIFALVTLVLSYYLGSRTGKGKKEEEKQGSAFAAIERAKAVSPLTYDESEYQSFADRLHTAMITLNDDESAIYSIFRKMRNKTDVLQLIQSFGKRGSWVWNVGGGSLSSWMSLKLTSGEIGTINGILKDNNIDFEF